MNFQLPALRWSLLPAKIRGMFNLNDPRWGRDDDNKSSGDTGNKPASDTPPPAGQKPEGWPQAPQGGGNAPSGPPDLDELWRDFNRKLGQMFGGKGGPQGPQGGSGGPSGGPQLPGFIKNLGLGVVIAAALLVWLGTGFFIVQEGQQAVITQFGKYHSTVGAGFNWRMPYPVQRHELVYVSQIRSVDIGRDTVIKATGLRESAMLT